MTTKVLRIDASARRDGSVSRQLADRVVARFTDAKVTARDLSDSLPHIDELWVGATFTPPENRSAEQRAKLALSDALVDEVEAADVIVVGTPIYNFNLPASLKAWIDQIGRVGRTFRYTENGPVGLLEGKRVIVALASAGTEIGSEVDYATGYLRFIFGFMGITNVEFVGATSIAAKADEALVAAHEAIDALPLAA